MLTQLVVHFLSIHSMQTVLHAASPGKSGAACACLSESPPRQHVHCYYPVTSRMKGATEATTPTLTLVSMLPCPGSQLISIYNMY